MKKSKKRGASIQTLTSINFYGNKKQYKDAKKIKKELLLTELQQSRKEIMVQRLELHNMRDQIEIFFRNFYRTQKKQIKNAHKLLSKQAHQIPGMGSTVDSQVTNKEPSKASPKK